MCIVVACVCLSLFMLCGYMLEGMYASACPRVWRPGAGLYVLFSCAPPLFFGDRLFYWTWSLPFWLIWITILLQGSLSYLPQVSGLQMGCRAFMCVLEIQIPQSSHLPSEPSPEATCLVFWSMFVIQNTKPCFRPSFFPLYCATDFSLVGWDCNWSSELDVTQ